MSRAPSRESDRKVRNPSREFAPATDFLRTTKGCKMDIDKMSDEMKKRFVFGWLGFWSVGLLLLAVTR